MLDSTSAHTSASLPRILIVTAVDAEREAVLRGIQSLGGETAAYNRPRFDVIAAGVGPASAAAGTAAALCKAEQPYSLVVSTGIGGGFPGVARIGAIVVANRIVQADLGVESAEGFLTVDELGFASAQAEADAAWNSRILSALEDAGGALIHGPIITVSAATGTQATAELRARMVAGAAAEGMEGFGVATAALQQGVPVTELRAISNAVGPRDRAAWRIGDALAALTTAFAAIASRMDVNRPQSF